jgi:hypothetical protein
MCPTTGATLPAHSVLFIFLIDGLPVCPCPGQPARWLPPI